MNRKIAPTIKDAIDFNLQLKPYTKFILDNGIEVYAIDAGAEEVAPAKDFEYGYRQGEIKDPFGHHWVIQMKI